MRLLLFSAASGLLVVALPAPAADLARSVTASANISAIAKLTVSPASLVFADADPDLVPAIPSSNGPVTIVAKARSAPGAQIMLTMVASDDLRSGMNTIPIAALKWTATGPGFVAGTTSRSASQTIALWADSGARTGTQSFTLENTWQRVPGTYSVSLVYTLTAP